MDHEKVRRKDGLQFTRVFACLISEGRAFHCLGIEQQNELSSLVLQLNFGTVIRWYGTFLGSGRSRQTVHVDLETQGD